MKLLAAVIALLSLAAAAMAKPDPMDPHDFIQPPVHAVAVYPDASAAAREANYFQAPQTRATDQDFSCRLRLLFSPRPIRLARSCP